MKLQVIFSIVLAMFTVYVYAEAIDTTDPLEQSESGDIQAQGEDILKTMAEVNRYWLSSPASEVKNYSYEFLLVDKDMQKVEVDKPAKSGHSYRQGISYYSVLHKLVSDPSAAAITSIQEVNGSLRLDFALKDSMKMASGNGISGSWRGYFSRRIDAGSVWLDMEKMVPIKVVAGDTEEYFSNYVNVSQAHYVPLAIKIDSGDMHFSWKFTLYEPGLWLFDMAEYQYKEEDGNLLVASIKNVKINTAQGQQNQLPVVPLAQTDESTSLRRMLSEGRKKMETIIEANHNWLLPTLDMRKGFVYQYRQEDPYLEKIMFDKQGNIMAQLESCKDSPDIPTNQKFYRPDGTSIRSQHNEAFVRPPQVSDDKQSALSPLVKKDRYVKNLATGLNFDCAVTIMARKPEIFHPKYELIDDQTYRLVLSTSNRDAKLFSGTMLAFTSWAYMHDVRFVKSEIICDAQTNQPLSEKDYDAEGNLVGSYTFSEYLKNPSGDAPGRIHAVIPHEKDGKDQSLEMDAVFEFVRPGLWLLKTCRSEFRGQEGGSTGKTEIVNVTEQSFEPITQLLSRLKKNKQLLSNINSAQEGRVVASLGYDNSISVYAKAKWIGESQENLDQLMKDAAGNDKPVISVVPSRYIKLDNGGLEVELNVFSNVYWKEFDTAVTIELLDSWGNTLSETSTSAKVRTKDSPRLTSVKVEFSDIENIDAIDNIAITATVKRMTAMYHGHGMWMTLL